MSFLHIIGDAMLDVYISGRSNRLSPEAPVPVIINPRSCEYLGGAANVSLCLKNLGLSFTFYGIIGADEPGEKIKMLCYENNLDFNFIEDLSSRTIQKMRIIANGIHMARLDHEDTFSQQCSTRLEQRLLSNVRHGDFVLISDYCKGTIRNISELITRLKKKDCLIFVDSKVKDLEAFRGVDFFTPNLTELSACLGIDEIVSEDDLIKYCLDLSHGFKIKNLIVTLGEKGVCHVSSNSYQIYPAPQVKTIEVSGAGDVLISTIAGKIHSGLSIEDAIKTGIRKASEAISLPGTSVYRDNS